MIAVVVIVGLFSYCSCCCSHCFLITLIRFLFVSCSSFVVCLPFHLFACLLVCGFACCCCVLSFFFLALPLCFFVDLSVCRLLLVCLFCLCLLCVSLLAVCCLFACLFVCCVCLLLFVCLFVCLFVSFFCLRVCLLFVRLFACLFIVCFFVCLLVCCLFVVGLSLFWLCVVCLVGFL